LTTPKTRYYEGKRGKIYNIHVYPVFEKGNEVEKTIILVEDITERKKSGRANGSLRKVCFLRADCRRDCS
jgi:hypothetical protein